MHYLLDFQPGWMILILLVVFGVVAIAVYYARKYIPFFRDDEKPLSDEEAAAETLKRFLVPVKNEQELKESETKVVTESKAKPKANDEDGKESK